MCICFFLSDAAVFPNTAGIIGLIGRCSFRKTNLVVLERFRLHARIMDVTDPHPTPPIEKFETWQPSMAAKGILHKTTGGCGKVAFLILLKEAAVVVLKCRLEQRLVF